MKSLDRYIMRQLLVGTTIIAAILTGVIWLIQSLKIIELMVTQGLSLSTFIGMTLLLMPNFLVFILPISLFAVVLFTYNKLSVDREMVIMRNSGRSNWSIGGPALLMALISTIVAWSLNLYIIPESYKAFRELQWGLRNNEASIFLREGVFNEVSKDFTVFVRERSPTGELLGIMVHERRDPTQPKTYIAEKGAIVESPNGPRGVLINGSFQWVDARTNRFFLNKFYSATIDFNIKREAEGERYREPRERSLDELFSVTEEEVGDKDFGRMRVEGHRRIYSPLANLAYALVGLAVLLTGQFSRRGQTERILVSIGAVLFLLCTDLGLATLTAKNLALVPLLYIWAVLPIAAAILLIQKANIRLSQPGIIRLLTGST